MKNILCIDGPMKGESLCLGLDQTTAVFTYKGQTGQYRYGRFYAYNG